MKRIVRDRDRWMSLVDSFANCTRGRKWSSKFTRELVVWTTVIRPRNTRSLNCRSEQLGPRFSINVRSWLASRPSRDAGRRQSSARIPTCTYLRTWEENPPLPSCLNLDCAHLYVILCEYLLYVLFLFYSTILFVFRYFPLFLFFRYEYLRYWILIREIIYHDRGCRFRRILIFI